MTTAKIKYVGNKPLKLDNVAGTGLAWTPGQSHDVEVSKAGQLLKFPGVWELDAPKRGKAFTSTEVIQESDLFRAGLLEIADKLGIQASQEASVQALESAIADKKSQMDADQIQAALGASA